MSLFLNVSIISVARLFLNKFIALYLNMINKSIKIILSKNEYQNEFVKLFGKSYFNSETKAKIHFKKNIENLYLLFVDNKLAGFFDYIYQYSHYANYLSNICIAKGFNGKGYSKHLLNKYIELSKEQRTKNKIALSSTHKSNKISQNMHLKFGFKEIGILKALHYGEDEIFYAYDLV